MCSSSIPNSDRPEPGSGPGRESLEAWLLPLVRRAIRSGSGIPALTSWVQRSLASLEGGPTFDPDRAAPGLTRLLCDALARPAESGGRLTETVLGP